MEFPAGGDPLDDMVRFHARRTDTKFGVGHIWRYLEMLNKLSGNSPSYALLDNRLSRQPFKL